MIDLITAKQVRNVKCFWKRFGCVLFKVNARLQINGLGSQNTDDLVKKVYILYDQYNTYLWKQIQHLTKIETKRANIFLCEDVICQARIKFWSDNQLICSDKKKNVWNVKLILAQSTNRWIEYLPLQSKSWTCVPESLKNIVTIRRD